MNEKNWTNQTITNLFSLVAEYKKQNKPLLKAFADFAKKTNKNPQSVRNFYYAKLKEVEKDKNLQNVFHINLDNHKKTLQLFFTKEESEEKISQIKKLISQGYSVRKACFEIANGNLKEMIRLQNKYRSQLIPKDNITVMPQKKPGRLSDDEITSLFLGLIKLVKKTAEENATTNFNLQLENANIELRKSIKSLSEKEREIKLLRKKFELLSNEKMKLSGQIQSLRSQNMELLQSDSSLAKMLKLKKYLGTPENLGARN